MVGVGSSTFSFISACSSPSSKVLSTNAATGQAPSHSVHPPRPSPVLRQHQEVQGGHATPGPLVCTKYGLDIAWKQGPIRHARGEF